MTNLIFLCDRLLNKEEQKLLKLPLTFISFAQIEGKLYKIRKHYISIHKNTLKRQWGNDMILGAIFLLDEFDFYIRQIDGYYGCSLSRININHKFDYMHRKLTPTTLIRFNTLRDLSENKITHITTIPTWAYFGNEEHPKIRNQIIKGRSRVLEGVDAINFKECYQQVNEV